MKDNSNTLTPTKKSNSKFKILSTVIAIIISVGIIAFKDHLGGFRQYGYFGVFIISVIGNATLFLPMPVLMTVAALGSALNPLAVGVIASLGAAIGESVGYFVGVGGNMFVEKNDKYKKAKNYIDKYGPWGIFFLAAIPNPLFDLAGIMAGALGITYSQFFFATWGGAFIKYTATSLMGLGIISLF